MSLRVTVLVPGPADRIGLCRQRINLLLDAERSERYRERHTADRLDYGITTRSGIPFPPFVNASAEFPDLVFTFTWEGLNGESSGRAVIANGCLLDQDAMGRAPLSPGGATDAVHIDAELNGTIRIAAALRVTNAGPTLGYAATAEQHAYFCYQHAVDAVELMMTVDIADAWSRAWEQRAAAWSSMPMPVPNAIHATSLAMLDDIANGFAKEWLWFAAEPIVDTALERHRFTLYNLTVRPANLRSAKLRTLPTDPPHGITYTTVGPSQTAVIDALVRCWITRP